MYPPENDDDVNAARVQKNSISGTIWSMSFISQDPNQSKGHNPILAVVINRYDDHVYFGIKRYHVLKSLLMIEAISHAILCS